MCICHAELKSYLLTYLISQELRYDWETELSGTRVEAELNFEFFALGMLIFENFISRYENFQSRDSSSTRDLPRHSETVPQSRSPPLPSPWGINYRRRRRVTATQATLLDLVGPCHTDRSMCRDSFSCLISGGCHTFTVCCLPDDVLGQTADHRWWSVL